MKYDIPQPLFLVSKYYEFKSMPKVINAWNTKYKDSDPPSHSTIKNIASDCLRTSKAENYKPKTRSRQIELVKMVAEFPSLSIRKAASVLSISPTLVYKIYTDDLHLSAY